MRTFRYFIFMVYLSCGFISCLLLYSKGFLLSRNIILQSSVCSDYTAVLNKSINISIGSSQTCYPTDIKVIFVIVDALRYDFVAQFSGENKKYYHNNFNHIHKLLRYNQHARLYKFIADPPTTTMQRLHGLMTGSLPTFIDIGSNFASSEIIEDNLLFQLRVNGKKTVFLGDDTWMSLFPKYFERSFPYPSFDVWDLDTVDAGVSKNIFTEINKKDWNLLIAHYLGVDHCGHRFGPNHPEMKRKLLEMDTVIKNIIDSMDQRTVLFVMGDHGMTENGDHGGASDDEVTAAIFVYSKSDLNSPLFNQNNLIQQVDILPTVSAILGVPIPFSNLGTLVFEMMPKYLLSHMDLNSSDFTCSYLVKNNINQIINYIKIYNREYGHFPPHEYKNILQKYETLTKDEDFSSQNYLFNAHLFMKAVQHMCKTVWTQFDFLSIFVGLILFFLLLFLLATINFISINVEKLNVKHFFIYLVVILFLIITNNYFSFLKSFMLFSIIVFLGSFLLLTNCLDFHSFTLLFCEFIYPIFVKLTVWELASIIMYICSFIGLFSNSYIVTESFVVTFLLITMILSIFFKVLIREKDFVLENKILGLKIKLCVFFITVSLCFILRTLPYFWKCYDEESSNCISIKASSFTSVSLTTITAILFLKCVTSLHFTQNASLITAVFKKIIIFLTALCSLFWVSSFYVTAYHVTNLDKIVNIFPQVVALFALIGIVYCLLYPFHFLRDSSFLNNVQRNVFFDFLNIYIMLGILFWILSLTIFNERRIISIVFLFTSIFLLLFLLGLNKVLKISSSREICNVSLWDLTAWHLSSMVHFYGTGHQPTFPSLQWEAVGPFIQAFPMFIPGFFMVINTFISYIIHSLLMPLVIIVPVSLSIYFKKDYTFKETSLIPRKLWTQLLIDLYLKTMFLQAIRMLVIMLSAAIQSRHLMVWKIFAPKLIFEAFGFCISLFISVLSFSFVSRISHQIEP